MDSADDPSLDMAQFLPRCTHGHVIITTRDRLRKILAPNSTHPIDELPLQESTTLLLNTSRYEDSIVNRQLSRDIAQELGCLPLALAHAGAYILLRQCLDTYLKTYRESRSRLLARKFDMPQGYPHSVARTIEISFEKLSREARDLLGLLSHLDARSIPQDIIEKAASRQFRHVAKNPAIWTLNNGFREYSDALNRILCPSGEWSSIELDDLLEECEKYSLVQFSTQSRHKFLSMHVLVQDFVRDNYGELHGHPSRRLVARLLGSAITVGDRYEYLAFNRLLSSHLRLIDLDDIVEAGDHYGYGVVLEEVGEGRLAVSHMERCVMIWRESPGQDSELTLDAMSILAWSYSTSGKEEDAVQLREKVVDNRKRLLGKDHLDTLKAMNALANSYTYLGRNEEVLPLMEEVLERRRRLLGEDHQDTLMAISNLAVSYSRLGRYEEALVFAEEVLEKQRRLLGDDHVDTLTAMKNLSNTYTNLGREEEALSLDEVVVEKRRRIFGEDHPSTLRAIFNLAISYSDLGRHEEALSLREEVLKQWTRLFGEYHRDTLEAMDAIAWTYAQLGREDDARKLEAVIVSKRSNLPG
jgi:tetratricopeptide (TPR) repeat protein